MLTTAVIEQDKMKKVILKKRIHEGGEREKPTMSETNKKEKTENANNTDDDTNNDKNANMITEELEEGKLVIDEASDDITTNDMITEEVPMDLSKEGGKRQEF